MTKARGLTIAAAGSAAALCMGAGAPAQPLADVEAANEQLVRSFFARASTDLAHYRAFLAEDVAFQYEDVWVRGLDALIARAAPKLSSVGGYEMDPVRLAVIGNTVLNERVDIAAMKDGRQLRLPVASLFLIADGRIAEWREFPLPGGADGPSRDEVANELLVRGFLDAAGRVDLDNPDPTYLRAYLSEDFIYQYGDLRIEGLDAFIARQQPALSSVESYSIDVRRLSVIGNAVLNERVDSGTLKDGQELRWHVSSVMLIKDGKIAEWLDYPMPDGTP